MIFISVIIPFCNNLKLKKVKNALKTKFRSWKISHVGTSLYALSTLTRNNNNHNNNNNNNSNNNNNANNNNVNNQSATYSTQSTNCTTRQKVDSNLCNDGARLPMLQEDKI